MVDHIDLYSDDSSRGIIERAKVIIKEKFSEDINSNYMTERLYINPVYLSKIFKKETGENFLQFLTRIRIEKAKELLDNTCLKLYEIVEMVGYQSPRHFSRIFKDYVGVNPTDYRLRRK